MRDEKRQLRDKENKLRDEKGKLMEKESHLSAEKSKMSDKGTFPGHRQDSLPEGRPPLYPSDKELEIERKIDRILEATKAGDRATPEESLTIVGKAEKERLVHDKRFFAFEERPDEESVLCDDESAALSLMENEHQVVAFMTPRFESVFSAHKTKFCVYNSEEHRWLKASSEASATYNLKPDLIVCHAAIVSRKQPFTSQDEVVQNLRSSNNFKYGVLAEWKLRHAIGLTCEAKMNIGNGNTAFGEVINYGSHLCFGKGGPVAARLLLFDKTQCWLIEVVKGAVANVTTCRWLDKGSSNLLRGFVRSDKMIEILQEACAHFSLTVEEDSFLGAGAFGHVFRATRIMDGKEVALKIVVERPENNDHEVRLETERLLMQAAYELCPEYVMRAEEDGFATFRHGAAFLLSEVGEHYSKLAPQKIVDSLKELHRQGILHGDARLENVLCVNGMPVWIDFADSLLTGGLPFTMRKEIELQNLKKCVAERFNGYQAS